MEQLILLHTFNAQRDTIVLKEARVEQSINMHALQVLTVIELD